MAEEIFKEHSSGIVRAEFKNFQPTSTLNLNTPNKRTTFLIDFYENFTTKNFQYYIAGEYLQNDGAQFAKPNVQLIQNFIPHLFSYIEVKKHGQVIDEVDFPGISSTMKQYVEYTKDLNSDMEASGLNAGFTGGGNFSALGKLSDLGLGFFEDVNIPIFRGGFEINFTRSNDNDALYRFKSKKTDGTVDDTSLPSEGKIIIKSFFIRAPIVEYEDTSKIQLLKSLEELCAAKKYTFDFKTWQCIQHKNVFGRTLNFDITNVYRNINSPVFALVAFQSDRSNDQQKNPAEFDHKYVKNIYVEVNGKRYPDELTDFDFEDNNYLIAYDMFKDYRRVFKKDSHNCIPKNEFKNQRPIFVIDLTKQPDNLANTKSNIVLHVDFSKNIDAPVGTSEGTVCYVVIVSFKSLQYDIMKNIIKEF